MTTFSWLIRDTFRQAFASGIAWLLAGLTSVCILVCLSASIKAPAPLAAQGENPNFIPRFAPEANDQHKLKQSGVAVADGNLSLAFGAVRVPITRDAHAAVHYLQLILAGGVADTLGLLLTLVWTAGFLPSFLHPRAVSVLLAKPVPRGGLLLGKYVGVLTFVLAQSTFFVGGTWLALGLRTHIWDPTYLLCIPLLLLHFAIFFSASLLLATWTRSTVLCVFGSIAFWVICWAVNFSRHALAAASQIAAEGSFSSLTVRLAEIGYWILPKPVDLGRLVFDALGASTSFRPLLDNSAAVWPTLSVLTSLLFTAYLLVAASRQFAQTDY
jgi:ABC-type transport system involved in multi-copper enzyme maturation permease subunit